MSHASILATTRDSLAASQGLAVHCQKLRLSLNAPGTCKPCQQACCSAACSEIYENRAAPRALSFSLSSYIPVLSSPVTGLS